ncbi:lovastatin nonaketide synthase [Xylariomycetidae sp. FL0641]|nr:lovastatin nonaketide synthase [Xylariomycetidae sp. FL0641]
MDSTPPKCPGQAPVPVAIVGIAFEFPQGATTDESFWQMITEGRSTCTEFPPDRLNTHGFYHPDRERPGSIPLKHGNFVQESLGAFDAPFFSITPAEAACMDPQHRRILELAYHALEDAGIPLSNCMGSDAAVYTGSFTNDWMSIMQQDYEAEQSHAAIGIASSMLANRLSWFFDFKGTSMNLDSACSSSLLALHLACQELRLGNTSMGVVGGANLVFHPNWMKLLTDYNFLSPSGRSRSFDQRADGYARGDGNAIIVVKRLEDAIRDGNPIRAVIRNTASNQDGKTARITQPSQSAQVQLIRRAYEQANLEMRATRFFEAHGTGTPVGDPVEANAIGEAFRPHRSADEPLYIGAVKANIGHLEGCSGLAGVIKTVLVLEKGVIPPIAGLDQLNSNIDATKLHLQVNSFGFGGTNAIAIIDNSPLSLPKNEENSTGAQSKPTNALTKIPDPPGLLTWSATNEKGVENLSAAYRAYIIEHEFTMQQLAYTLTAGRTLFPWRSFAVVPSQTASGVDEVVPAKPIKATQNAGVGFVFTGQGSQYLGMGRELLAFPAFVASLENAQKCLESCGCQWSIRGFIEGTEESLDLNAPEFSQPASTCLQIALVDLLRSFGVRPAVVLGHSSGEIAAAYATGALSQLSAITIAYHRGALSSRFVRDSSTEAMSMMAVGLSKQEVSPYLDRLREMGELKVFIGCVNSPKSVTLSGNANQIEMMERWFKDDSVFARRLRIPIAYHSPYLNGIADEYTARLGGIGHQDAAQECPMISTLTQDMALQESLGSPAYWVKNLTSPVQFEGAFSVMLRCSSPMARKQTQTEGVMPANFNVSHVLEVGPHSTLQGPVRDCLGAFAGAVKPTYMSCLGRNSNAAVGLLTAVGELHCAGLPLDILRVNRISDSAKPPFLRQLPRYPFDHTARHWHESRLSQNFRFRAHARHELLGTRNPDWNPQAAQWRNILRLRELPWLEDHRISGQIIVPAAAMVAIAVEGLRQLSGDGSPAGLLLQDVTFPHPIKFDAGVDAVETQMNISSYSPSTATGAWSRFRLFVIEGGRYTETCSGFIRRVSEQERRGIASHPAFLRGREMHAWVNDTREACSIAVADPYQTQATSNIQYGPCFQNLTCADVDTGSWRQKDKQGFASPYPLLVPALAQQRPDLPTLVPVRVASLWLDCGGRLERGYRGAAADIVCTATASDHPLVYLEGLEATFIDDGGPSEDTAGSPRALCKRIIWKPDLDLMSHRQILHHCTRDRPQQPPNVVKAHHSLLTAIACFVVDATRYIEEARPHLTERHLQAYVGWMKYQQQRLVNGESPFSPASLSRFHGDQGSRESLIREVENTGVDGVFFMQVGRNLVDILRGAVDPLDLMFKDGLADRFYEQTLADVHCAHPASAYMELLCFKNPALRILEVGAGTGGQTLRLLETLGRGGVHRWARYDYTDVSPSFFARARAKFAAYAGRMGFRLCDIARDPAAQSFEPGSYDVVVASHVLHATDDLDGSLRNVRALLKPGGKLLLFETTDPDALQIGFAFGLLKGWWSPLEHEPRSPYSPCLTVEQWRERLQRTGFSGVDVEIPGQEEPRCRYSSFMVSTATTPAEETSEHASQAKETVALVVDGSISVQVAEAAKLTGSIEEAGPFSCRTFTLSEIAQATLPEPTTVVFFVEMDAVFLGDLTDHKYDEVKSVLTRTKTSLWVTRASHRDMEPQHHLARGLGRGLMSEESTRKFVTLTLEAPGKSLSGGKGRNTGHILQVLEQVMKNTVENQETNYVVENGVLQTSRITEYAAMDTTVAQAVLPRRKVTCRIGAETHVGLRLPSPGHLDTLEWSEQIQESDEPLAGDEVLVQARAYGLTHRDHLVASGQLNDLTLGLECAGIVRAAGSASGYRPGDRVCVLGPPGVQSVFRAHAGAVAAMPSHLGFAEAAALPVAVWMAYHTLHRIANLQPDETVLVLQASSCGSKVLATVSSPAKAAFLRDTLKIPGSSILYGMVDDHHLAGEALRKTNGHGVDVVVGPLEYRGHMALSTCLAPFGRIVDTKIGKVEALTEGRMELPSNVSRSTVDLVELLKEKPSIIHRTFQRSMKAASGASWRPAQPLHIFSVAEVKAAFRHFEDPGIVGKRVLAMEPEMEIMASIKSKPRYTFPSDATYVIAGGLGGLGRSFARWMASRGARNLVLLSRSGAKDGPAQRLVDELTAQGVTVAVPRIDIGNLSALEREVHSLGKSMPPIRGCIQTAVALRDNLFENMSFEDWRISTNSKVTGSWNLHAVLPSNLDFFILLSSLNGVFGSGGQANYAAGNIFKDALAHHRIGLGQKAVSIDLGLIVTEGVVAESAFLLASVRRIGNLMEVQNGELLALLDHYCDPGLPLLEQDEAQVLVGIEMPEAVLAKGIDLHHSYRRPMFRQLFRMSTGSHADLDGGADSEPLDRATALKTAESVDEATALVTQWFTAKVAQVLNISATDVDVSKPVHSYGIDSLVAIDLRNWFRSEIGADVHVLTLLGNTALEQLCAVAAQSSRYRYEKGETA